MITGAILGALILATLVGNTETRRRVWRPTAIAIAAMSLSFFVVSTLPDETRHQGATWALWFGAAAVALLAANVAVALRR
jgi:hypothetical protein